MSGYAYNAPPPGYVPAPCYVPPPSYVPPPPVQPPDVYSHLPPPIPQDTSLVPTHLPPPIMTYVPPPDTTRLLPPVQGALPDTSLPPPLVSHLPLPDVSTQQDYYMSRPPPLYATEYPSSSGGMFVDTTLPPPNILPPARGTSDVTKDECTRQQEEFILKCMYPKRHATSPTRSDLSRSSSSSRRSQSTRDSGYTSNNGGKSSLERPHAHSSLYGSLNIDRKKKSSSPTTPLDRKLCLKKQMIEKWRMNNCSSTNEMSDQLEEISHMKPEEIVEREKVFWIRTAPADLYYVRKEGNSNVLQATEKLINLCNRFEDELIKRGERVRALKPPYTPPCPKKKLNHRKCCNDNSDSESDSSNSSSDSDDDDGLLEELERKRSHPDRLHPELWYNDPGEMNDGPLCRCSAKAKRSGIRHNIYAGELNLVKCDVNTNNADSLYHYRITISPPTNFLIKTPTLIEHDHHEFIFEGFSMLSHKPLQNLPVCKVIRFNIEYTILYIEEKLPDHFTIHELDLFYEYLFKEILELVDLDLKAAGDSNGCSQFHFMPRFVRELPENGKEILSMNVVLSHLLQSSKPLIAKEDLEYIINLPLYKWQNLVDEVKGMVVTYPGKKPCSVRVDQLDKDQSDAKDGVPKFPEIVHFGIRPPQLSYAGNPEYQKAWREYVKFRHLLANMPKASFEEKRKLEAKENKLQEMRTQTKMKRDVTIAISSQGFYRTGIMCDVVQHAMLIPVLVSHLRFHRSLDVLENDIHYTFDNRNLLQLALTHPSYSQMLFEIQTLDLNVMFVDDDDLIVPRENFGTNPDHARNSLTNCGIRQPEYGDRRIHYMNTRKRGINTLINIMSRFGKKRATESNITHNERLEFLGDAVVEFVTSIHLFHLFPRLEEGGLATYRAAIVQNQHLAVLAKTLNLDSYMLYAHGSDLCHDLELRHAMANCFEALMGALFLDGGIHAADRVFGETLFKESKELLKIWTNYPPHPLQEQEPNGDRKWINSFKILHDLTVFEESIGVKFTHIRLLARAFTDRSIGYTNLTLGSNQRLEFLGDTVLQLIASEYLYKHFPEHHEGHLSLLRSSLVNNRTQSVVCDDLGIAKYAIYANPKAELKTKDRADLLEAFLGALYVDKGLEYCETFCNVCFFPRLHDFIMHQDWNDPKSKLQQCCLTLRTMEGGEPEIPIYKVIECMGPTNTRLYTVAVYFKGKRLAQASGHSIQQAEMNAAKQALHNSQKLFPQLDHQKRVIAKSMKRQRPNVNANGESSGLEEVNDCSSDESDSVSKERDSDSDSAKSNKDSDKDSYKESDKESDYDSDRESYKGRYKENCSVKKRRIDDDSDTESYRGRYRENCKGNVKGAEEGDIKESSKKACKANDDSDKESVKKKYSGKHKKLRKQMKKNKKVDSKKDDKVKHKLNCKESIKANGAGRNKRKYWSKETHKQSYLSDDSDTESLMDNYKQDIKKIYKETETGNERKSDDEDGRGRYSEKCDGNKRKRDDDSEKEKYKGRCDNDNTNIEEEMYGGMDRKRDHSSHLENYRDNVNDRASYGEWCDLEEGEVEDGIYIGKKSDDDGEICEENCDKDYKVMYIESKEGDHMVSYNSDEQSDEEICEGDIKLENYDKDGSQGLIESYKMSASSSDTDSCKGETNNGSDVHGENGFLEECVENREESECLETDYMESGELDEEKNHEERLRELDRIERESYNRRYEKSFEVRVKESGKSGDGGGGSSPPRKRRREAKSSVRSGSDSFDRLTDTSLPNVSK